MIVSGISLPDIMYRALLIYRTLQWWCYLSWHTVFLLLGKWGDFLRKLSNQWVSITVKLILFVLTMSDLRLKAKGPLKREFLKIPYLYTEASLGLVSPAVRSHYITLMMELLLYHTIQNILQYRTHSFNAWHHLSCTQPHLLYLF